jgi:DNA-binding beta-propeller fold protein YncE
VTHTWVWMGQSEGVKFNGTAFDELIAAKAMHLGGAWDPVTDNMYFADAQEFWAVNNLKFLFVGYPCFASNGVAVNSMTNRVYVSSSCGSIIAYDGAGFTGFKNPAPQPLAGLSLGAQPSGIAVNPNTNRIYAAMVDAGTLDVIDASTFQVVAAIPGLAPPDTNGATTTFEWLDRRAVSIAVNTITDTIYAVNPGNSTVSVFDGNTNTLTGTITTPDGAVAVAVNEQTNTLYVANSAGTVSVYALDPPSASPTFSVNGVIRDSFGVAQAGINVTAAGAGGTASAVTDAVGLFVLTGLGSGTYTITPASPSFSFAPQTVSITASNLGGLAFVARPPIVPVSYALSPWNMIGAGATTTGTVTLNQPAPAGGAVVALSSSDTKAAKVPATVTVPAGQSQASFSVQGSGVSATTAVTLKAAYNGGTASTVLTVAPSDSLRIMKATWSKTSQVLTVAATGTNSQATIVVQDGKTNAILGTMVNLGGGSYSFQRTISSGVPTSVNVISNLGGKTGQGVSVIN